MEKISLTVHVKNMKRCCIDSRGKELSLHTIGRRKGNWIGHTLHRNCLLKLIVKGNIEETLNATERRGRRRNQIMDNLKERRGYWKLKEEELDSKCEEIGFKWLGFYRKGVYGNY
jgi:hypothetical protein